MMKATDEGALSKLPPKLDRRDINNMHGISRHDENALFLF